MRCTHQPKWRGLKGHGPKLFLHQNCKRNRAKAHAANHALSKPDRSAMERTTPVHTPPATNLAATDFDVAENIPNTEGSASTDVTTTATVLQTLTLFNVPAGSRVWLTGCVGWYAKDGAPTVQLKIERGSTVIYSGKDSCSHGEQYETTPFNTVDLFADSDTVTYTLTIQQVNNEGKATVVGPLTLTGAVFKS